MASDRKALIEALRRELAFIECSGYRRPEHAPWRAQFMFEDSPTCINRDSSQAQKPCGECSLIAFVPDDRRKKPSPCRYIPLNEIGETVDSLYRTGTQEQLEATVVAWLKDTIARLQQENEEASWQTPTVHVKGKVVSMD